VQDNLQNVHQRHGDMEYVGDKYRGELFVLRNYDASRSVMIELTVRACFFITYFEGQLDLVLKPKGLRYAIKYMRISSKGGRLHVDRAQ
jgi:hypothetical protein